MVAAFALWRLRMTTAVKMLMADTSLSGHRVAHELDRVFAERGNPSRTASSASFNGKLRPSRQIAPPSPAGQ